MFVWYEIQNLVGFSDEMVNYRDSMVREVNFVFSDRFSNMKDDPKIQKE